MVKRGKRRAQKGVNFPGGFLQRDFQFPESFIHGNVKKGGKRARSLPKATKGSRRKSLYENGADPLGHGQHSCPQIEGLGRESFARNLVTEKCLEMKQKGSGGIQKESNSSNQELWEGTGKIFYLPTKKNLNPLSGMFGYNGGVGKQNGLWQLRLQSV